MKRADVKVGGHYKATVSGRIVTVRLDAIRKVTTRKTSGLRTSFGEREVFDITNLTTGRTTTFKSAAKFRSEARNPVAKAEGDLLLTAAKLAEKVLEIERGDEQSPPFAQAGRTPSEPGQQPVVQPQGDEQRDPFAAAPATSPSLNGSASVSSAPGTTTSERHSTTGPSLASKLLGGSRTPAAPAVPYSTDTRSVAGYTPTDEQRAILEAARQPGLKVLVIAAGAGAGKTSTLKMLEETLPGRGQYTAFNASLVAESKTKFRRAVCNTTHSLAFQSVGRLYAHRLGGSRIRAGQVAEMLDLKAIELDMPPDPAAPDKPKKKTLPAPLLASMVQGAVKRFCQSADDEPQVEHVRRPAGIDHTDADGRTDYTNSDLVREHLLPFVAKAWKDLSDPNGKLPFAHDVYVKAWQLGRGQDTPVIHADYILLDEAQDSAPVLLDVLKRQSALLVLVGDSNQSIYQWRGAVDAMQTFPDSSRCLLSQSFRFGQSVADVANSILAGLGVKTDLVMKGLESIPSRVFMAGEAAAPQPDCVLTRTNAAAVGTVLRAFAEGRKPHLIGGGAEVVKFVRAAQDLQKGRSTSHPELCCFESWAEVQTYCKEEDGEDLKTMVKLIDEFGAGPIVAALERMPAEADADLVACTAHKSKGREWDNVQLAPDFPPANRMTDSDRRLLYVAATRARHCLDLSVCPPFLSGTDKKTGEEIVPLRIRWTAPRPTAEQLAAFLEGKGIVKAKPTVAQDARDAESLLKNPLPPQPNGFSWAKHGEQWVVRGPKGATGTVTVARKNGTTSTEKLAGVVKSYPEADLYRVG